MLLVNSKKQIALPIKQTPEIILKAARSAAFKIISGV